MGLAKRWGQVGVDAGRDWFTAPAPLGRIAAFRTLLYLYIVLDLLVITPDVAKRGTASGGLYQPVYIAEFLHLPTPNKPLVTFLFWALLVLAPLAATGRAPRLLGFTVFAFYLEWMFIYMSYGKVDHGRGAVLVALAVLPFIGRARHGDKTLSEAAGWALRSTQIVVVLTYFLAAWSKIMTTGLASWANSAVYTKAVLRRGTIFSVWALKVSGLLIFAQWGTMIMELCSPVVFFVKQRLRYLIVAGFYSFHVIVFMGTTIGFFLHLAAMASFLPLEKVRPVRAGYWCVGRATGRSTDRVAAAVGRRLDKVVPGRKSAATDKPEEPELSDARV
ncbi:MAG: MFS transporter permease [Stackebrandtia sp.]